MTQSLFTSPSPRAVAVSFEALREQGLCSQALVDCGGNVRDELLRSLGSEKTLQAVLDGLASLLLVPRVPLCLMVGAGPH